MCMHTTSHHHTHAKVECEASVLGILLLCTLLMWFVRCILSLPFFGYLARGVEEGDAGCSGDQRDALVLHFAVLSLSLGFSY